MDEEKRKLAIELISASNSCKVSFNVPVKNHYSNVFQILIHESNADIINKLIAAGFSLSMTKKGLSISHYK